ncbi:hypothetical protein VTI74DRAFT_6603 [Chaetomium olivicolor]
MNQDKPLPTSRALLTSLLTAISTIPLLPSAQQPEEDEEEDAIPQGAQASETKPSSSISDTNTNTNPLRLVPASHRHLIITLHVLFPGMVLPALDLLERGLVSRVSLLDGGATDARRSEGEADSGRNSNGNNSAAAGAGRLSLRRSVAHPEDDADAGAGAGERAQLSGVAVVQEEEAGQRNRERERKGNAFFYLVASSAAAAEAQALRERRGRRRMHSGGGERGGQVAGGGPGAAKGYVVRLEAWNCTCATFAFAAVHGEGSSPDWEWESTKGPQKYEKGAALEWSVGGMSLDGLANGEAVPVCKHLLACVLAERWRDALGRYVVERRVSRAEMAGIAADI